MESWERMKQAVAGRWTGKSDKTGITVLNPSESISEKDGLYNTYHEQKQRFKELQTVKRNIDQILRREEPHRRKEQSHER